MLIKPFPKMIKPPQSPVALFPTASLEVNTIGEAAVPSAIIFDPLVIIKQLLVVKSPLITVPA